MIIGYRIRLLQKCHRETSRITSRHSCSSRLFNKLSISNVIHPHVTIYNVPLSLIRIFLVKIHPANLQRAFNSISSPADYYILISSFRPFTAQQTDGIILAFISPLRFPLEDQLLLSPSSPFTSSFYEISAIVPSGIFIPRFLFPLLRLSPRLYLQVLLLSTLHCVVLRNAMSPGIPNWQ